jgi:hypothetical protein
MRVIHEDEATRNKWLALRPQICFIDDVGYFYRKHDKSITCGIDKKTSGENMRRSLDNAFCYIENHLPERQARLVIKKITRHSKCFSGAWQRHIWRIVWTADTKLIRFLFIPLLKQYICSPRRKVTKILWLPVWLEKF